MITFPKDKKESKKMKDFFISYNKTDKEWAKWIAGTLEEYGYETVIQEWDFEPGNNFILKMQEAILNSKKTILVLSHSYLNSKYCKRGIKSSRRYVKHTACCFYVADFQNLEGNEYMEVKVSLCFMSGKGFSYA